MRGIISQVILRGIKANDSQRKIKQTLKKLHNITIAPQVFKTRYNAIKSRISQVLPEVTKASRKDNKRK
jgi:hypothetical protein